MKIRPSVRGWRPRSGCILLNKTRIINIVTTTIRGSAVARFGRITRERYIFDLVLSIYLQRGRNASENIDVIIEEKGKKNENKNERWRKHNIWPGITVRTLIDHLATIFLVRTHQLGGRDAALISRHHLSCQESTAE